MKKSTRREIRRNPKRNNAANAMISRLECVSCEQTERKEKTKTNTLTSGIKFLFDLYSSPPECGHLHGFIDMLPRLDLSWLWLLYPYYLVGIEDTERIKGKLQPSHSIDSRLAQFVIEIISLHQANTMFTGHGSFHFHCPDYHPMDKLFG